jgi:hypothetical protein
VSDRLSRLSSDEGTAKTHATDPIAINGRAYLSDLTNLRDPLKAGLSGAPQKEGKEEGPSISEVAGRIKAIKAARSVEPTPERVRQKHSSAEEPITARIRRRTEAFAVSDRATEPDAGASTTLTSLRNMCDITSGNRLKVSQALLACDAQVCH